MISAAITDGKTELTLQDVQEGSTLRILGIAGVKESRKQLARMGIQTGDVVVVRRRVPFGGPVVVERGGIVIALGKRFACQIKVERLS
ncbi:MAG: FeoA family protein [Acidobacteriota bacterium]